MTAPKYRDVLGTYVPFFESDGLLVKLISGKFGDVVGALSTLEIDYFDISLKAQK